MKYLKLILCAAICLLFIGCENMPIESKPTASELAMEDGQIVIVIDAGHGLADVGAINEENLGKVTEADINFIIASRIAELLSEKYTVIMTHDGKEKPFTEYDDGKDTYGPSERADFSNSTAADLFISVHCDSFPSNADVYGTRLYYADGTPNATEFDEKIAKAVGNAIDEKFGEYKKVILKPMDANSAYTVLYKTKVPSLLIECGFITNEGDAERLTDADWQNGFATAITNGIDEYFK